MGSLGRRGGGDRRGGQQGQRAVQAAAGAQAKIKGKGKRKGGKGSSASGTISSPVLGSSSSSGSCSSGSSDARADVLLRNLELARRCNMLGNRDARSPGCSCSQPCGTPAASSWRSQEPATSSALSRNSLLPEDSAPGAQGPCPGTAPHGQGLRVQGNRGDAGSPPRILRELDVEDTSRRCHVVRVPRGRHALRARRAAAAGAGAAADYSRGPSVQETFHGRGQPGPALLRPGRRWCAADGVGTRLGCPGCQCCLGYP